jgi:hypothetical protein
MRLHTCNPRHATEANGPQRIRRGRPPERVLNVPRGRLQKKVIRCLFGLAPRIFAYPDSDGHALHFHWLAELTPDPSAELVARTAPRDVAIPFEQAIARVNTAVARIAWDAVHWHGTCRVREESEMIKHNTLAGRDRRTDSP